MAEPPHAAYCRARVRRLDRDRYLTALFAPADRRADLFALYALNIEIARTREAVSEPLLGRVRLQWWREALDGAPSDEPVAAAVAAAVARRGLDRALLGRMIDGRALDLDDEPPANLAALEGYAEDTSATLAWLALEVLGAADAPARAAARHVGIAWALTGLLRAVPFHARSRRLYLPRDLTAAAGLSVEALFAGRPGAALAAVATALAAAAREHLGAARALAPRVPAAARPALLCARLADDYLDRLAGAGHDPFDTRIAAGRVRRQWRLLTAALGGRY